MVSFQVTSVTFCNSSRLAMLKPKSGLSPRKHIGTTRFHFKSPRLHFPIVQGMPVLKPKSGLRARRPIGTPRFHFKSPRLHFPIVYTRPAGA